MHLRKFHKTPSFIRENKLSSEQHFTVVSYMFEGLFVKERERNQNNIISLILSVGDIAFIRLCSKLKLYYVLSGHLQSCSA